MPASAAPHGPSRRAAASTGPRRRRPRRRRPRHVAGPHCRAPAPSALAASSELAGSADGRRRGGLGEDDGGSFWPLRKISVEFSTKRKIAVQFCKISDNNSTAIWRTLFV
eukprot:scaffold25060_cov75-Isochrysis_galbana.AAC.2